MRRLRASLCLALSLLTAGVPSLAAEIEVRPEAEAPVLRLEMPALPVLPQSAGVSVEGRPLIIPAEAALSAPEAAVSQKALVARQAQSAGAAAQTSMARVETIAAVAAGAQKAEASTQSAEQSRVWAGERSAQAANSAVAAPIAPSYRSSFLSRPRRWAATVAALAVPTLGYAQTGTAAAAPAAPAVAAHAAMPAGIAHFMAAYGRYVAGGAIIVGTYVAGHAASFLIDKIAEKAKAKPTTRAALRLAATAATWIGGALIGLHAAGMPAAELTPASLFGSLGVSLIVKDLISNVIEGAKVLLNQPFKQGDKIQIAGKTTYTVVGQNLHHLDILPEHLKDSPEEKEYLEIAESSIKVFRPYSTAHKTRFLRPVSLTGVLAGIAKAPGLMLQATRDMPRPDLKRATVWLLAGIGVLAGIPYVKKAVLDWLPVHLAAVSTAMGWTSAGLAAAGVGYVAWRIARLLKTAFDVAAQRRGWSPTLRRAVFGAAAALIAAGAVALIVAGFPILKTFVTISLAANLVSVAGTISTVFGYVQAVAVLCAARSAHKWTIGFIDHVAAKFKLNPQFVQALKLGVDALALVVGGALALRQIGVSGIGLFKTLAIGSTAVSIAAAGVVNNLIRGFILLVRRPFEVGGWIEVDGYVGKVQDITVQYVVLSEDDNATHILVPQSIMKKGFTPLRTPEDVARAKAHKKELAAQDEFLASLYEKSKTR